MGIFFRLPSGTGGAVLVIYATWDDMITGTLAGGDGAQGGLASSVGCIARVVNVNGVLVLVGNFTSFGAVDDTASPFTISNAAGSGNIRHLKSGSSAPVWGAKGASTGGLIVRDGAILLDFLKDVKVMTGLGFLAATATSTPTITTAVNGQQLGGAGFLRDTRTNGHFSGVFRRSAVWEQSFAFMPGADPGVWTPVAAATTGQRRPDAETSETVMSYAQSISRSTDGSFGRVGFLVNAYPGDSATVSHHDAAALIDAGISFLDSTHEPIIVADELSGSGGEGFSRFTEHAFLNTIRAGGFTP